VSPNSHHFHPLPSPPSQSKDRFRKEMRHMMVLLCDVYPFSKYTPLVINATQTKNSRTRATCLDELRRVLEMSPTAMPKPRGLRDIVRYVEARESEVRPSPPLSSSPRITSSCTNLPPPSPL
jgi:hypothetical protein